VSLITELNAEPSEPAGPTHPPAAGVEPSPGAWAVARALARAEVPRLLRHPAFVAGVVVTVLLIGLTGGQEPADWQSISVDIGLVLVPFGWLTLIATNLVALRDRRHGTTELVGTAPAEAPARTLGVVLATMVTAPVTVALLAAAIGWNSWRHGPIGGELQLLELAVPVLLVVGGGIVGVAVARWIPRPVAAIGAIVVTIQIEVWMTRSDTSPTRWLAFWAEPHPVRLPEVELRPAAWHLVWLAAWVVIMAVVAVARHGLRRPLPAFAGGALVVATVAGWNQTRPMTEAQLERAVSVLTAPEQHQVCEIHGAVTYCAYPHYRFAMKGWRQAVDGVLAAVPSRAQRPLEVRQRIATVIGDYECRPQEAFDLLHPRLRERLDADAVWRRDGAVHPAIVPDERLPCGGRSLAWLSTAIATGAWAVGLPPAPWDQDERCRADGQARSAVALWLGAQAVPGGTASLQAIADDHAITSSGRIEFGRHWNEHPQWGVRWNVLDLRAALALLELPQGAVRAALAEHWERIVDPSTTTVELRELLGSDGSWGLRSTDTDCTPPPAD
jgi:hypothetical protein